MKDNKWLLILEDDLNKKGEKEYLELKNDVDEFTLLDNILRELYDDPYGDIISDQNLPKNIKMDKYKRKIMSIDEIGLIISRNFEHVSYIKENIESYSKIKKINLTDLYNCNEKNNTDYWILKLRENGISPKNNIYFKIPSNITYNEIFKNITNIIEIYDNNFKLKDEIYSDYITLEQIKNIVLSLFDYTAIEPINMLRDDNEYNNRLKVMDLSNINGRETGRINIEKYINTEVIKNNNIYFNRIDGKAEIIDKSDNAPLEYVFFPDESIIKNEIHKVIKKTKCKFDKYNIVANGKLIRLIIGEEKDIYVRDEESVKKLDEFFLLAPLNEGTNNIFCYMIYIIGIYRNLTSKTIKAPLMQLLLNKIFGLKILSKNDKISRKVIASEYYSDYTCQTSIEGLNKYANDFKDNLKLNERNKEEDIKIISEIIKIKK